MAVREDTASRPDGLDGEARIRRARRNAYIGVGIIAAVVLALIVGGVLLLLPYHPLTVYSYTPAEDEACVNSPADVYVDFEIEPETHVESMDIRGGWVAVDVPGQEPGTEIFVTRAKINQPDAYLDPGRKVEKSRAPRPTPGIPGLWAPMAEVTVRGWAYGVPHSQVVTEGATGDPAEALRVLPADSEEC